MQQILPMICTGAFNGEPTFETCALRSYGRQDDCQDRLQCYSLQLVSELGVVLDTRPFSGPNASMYGGCQHQGL
jgi:hypothetical protein